MGASKPCFGGWPSLCAAVHWLRPAAGTAPGAADGESRFVMLELIREYALERLEASGEADALRRQHATVALALAEAAEPELRGPRQGMWLQRLEAEHENLAAALQWALQAQQGAMAMRLAGALWQFWYLHGHPVEGRRWLEDVLAGCSLGESPAATAERAKARAGAAALARYQGDYGRAQALHEASLVLYRELGGQQGIAGQLHGLGSVALDQGDAARALPLFSESLALYRELGDRQ